MKTTRKIVCFILCMICPNRLIFWILNLVGHKVHPGAKIGFSVIWIDGILILENKSRIGHLNRIVLDNLSLGKGSYIGNYNNIKGPIDIQLAENAAIGNGNNIYRGPLGVTYGRSLLQLGILSKITANHRVDCTRSVLIGNYNTIAGHETQLWTHAYYHDKSGPGRFRLDGEVKIGNNVYIGSRCIVNMGVQIADTVVVGANACISKSLLEAGTYVNQPIRMIAPSTESDARDRFKRIEGFDLCEEVYEKK